MKTAKTPGERPIRSSRTDGGAVDPQPTLRAVPVQARAKQSVENILNTAAHLLDEVGLDGFNTNLLAERADVRIRTIYRYFPDKYAIIVALASRMYLEWDEWMDREFLKLADPRHEWESEQRRIIPMLLKKTADQPGGISIAKALGGIPELMAMDIMQLERMSQKMAAALKQRGVKLSPARLRSICRVSLLSVNAGVDVYFRLDEAQRAQFLSELISMQIAYLRLYL